jgi:hypothetical protein
MEEWHNSCKDGLASGERGLSLAVPEYIAAFTAGAYRITPLRTEKAL